MVGGTEQPGGEPRGSWLRWGIPVVGVIVIAAVGAAMLPRNGSGGNGSHAVAPARRGPLLISVTESGAIRPREQIVLKNELDDPATIVFIVDEGTAVRKGDLICELDVTLQKKALVERRIRVQSAESALVFADENFKIAENQGQADIEQAQLLYNFAERDLVKYKEGEYPRLLKQAEANITLAGEEVARAKEMYNWSKILFDEKFLSLTALQQDELTAKKAQLALDLAREDLALLKNFNHERTLATLESGVRQTKMAVERTRRKVAASMAQAEADVKAKRALLEEERRELDELEQEVAKSRIHAPIDGMVLYASSVDWWDDDEDRIDEGALVDERGEIVYLPTTSAFNVDVKTLEVNLRKVRPGQDVRVTVDAIPGQVFTGKVTRIAPLPDGQSRFLNPNLKVYNTIIEVDGSGLALRNGMSCRVEIMVERYDDAVHVPIQCVTRVGGQTVVHVQQGGRAVSRPVEIGYDNGRFIHIRSGLSGGEPVMLAPPLSADDLGDQREKKQQEEALASP
jgi:HlyD family secretion protein